MPRAATVEAERELVEVVVEVLVTDRALVGSEQPGLQQGNDQVYPRERLASRPLAREQGPLMLVSELVQANVVPSSHRCGPHSRESPRP